MHDNIRFWLANFMQIIGLATIVGFIPQSYRPSTRRMAQERSYWNLAGWHPPRD